MALSKNPRAREAQLANLRRGGIAPAPIGSAHARTHGGYAAIARAELEDRELEVFEALASDAPLRDGDGGLPAADALAVRLLAEVLIRLDRVRAHVGDFGILDQETGAVRPVVELEARLRGEALNLAEALGMTPRARVRMGVDVVRTVSAAQEAAEAEERRAATARLDQKFDAIKAKAANQVVDLDAEEEEGS